MRDTRRQVGLDEIAIIDGLRRSDESCLRALVDTLGAFVYGEALQVTQEPVAAGEVAEETFGLLWNEPELFEASNETLQSFLVGVARRKAIDSARSQENDRYKESLHPSLETLQDEDLADPSILDPETREALMSLPRAKREVLLLAYYKGLTCTQIGQALGVPEGTVKIQLRESLTKLKSLITPRAEETYRS